MPIRRGKACKREATAGCAWHVGAARRRPVQWTDSDQHYLYASTTARRRTCRHRSRGRGGVGRPAARSTTWPSPGEGPL